ncbi:MAG: hypothetical protein QOH97_3538 [Actinoplanes sp.]|jgi:hypothetical protein|nr:hypothetical protein [Actinoplanes sp.]
MQHPANIRLRAPADVVAVVPYLLGYHPSPPSLVALGLAGPRVAFTACASLTDSINQDEIATAVGHLVEVMIRQRPTSVALVGYGSNCQVRSTLRVATDAIRAARLPIPHMLRVDAGRIFNPQCRNSRCCPPAGTPFNASSTVAAATATVAGLVALPDRAALQAQVAPIAGAQRMAFAVATRSALIRLMGRIDRATATAGPDALASLFGSTAAGSLIRQGHQAVRDALVVYRAGQVLATPEAAMLTVLLSLPPVREAAIAGTTDDSWQISLWSDLLRHAEPGFAATPGILLTLCAMQAGNGALAGCALDRALAADPTNRLAGLLVQALHRGIAPTVIAGLIRPR